MIPEKIRPYFNPRSSKNDGDNTLTRGILTCCGSHSFEVRTIGEVKRGLLSKLYLLSEAEGLKLEARCKHCGKTISVFDSSCDGYDPQGSSSPVPGTARPVHCPKCSQNDFSAEICWEYPGNLELPETGNEFTWIGVTLSCNQCGRKYRDFLDLETG